MLLSCKSHNQRQVKVLFAVWKDILHKAKNAVQTFARVKIVQATFS